MANNRTLIFSSFIRGVVLGSIAILLYTGALLTSELPMSGLTSWTWMSLQSNNILMEQGNTDVSISLIISLSVAEIILELVIYGFVGILFQSIAKKIKPTNYLAEAGASIVTSYALILIVQVLSLYAVDIRIEPLSIQRISSLPRHAEHSIWVYFSLYEWKIKVEKFSKKRVTFASFISSFK